MLEPVMLTPEDMRELANRSPRDPFWAGQARQTLLWAADALEAAKAAIDENYRTTVEPKP